MEESYVIKVENSAVAVEVEALLAPFQMLGWVTWNKENCPSGSMKRWRLHFKGNHNQRNEILDLVQHIGNIPGVSALKVEGVLWNWGER